MKVEYKRVKQITDMTCYPDDFVILIPQPCVNGTFRNHTKYFHSPTDPRLQYFLVKKCEAFKWPRALKE